MTSRYTREHSVGWMNGVTRLEDAPTVAERFHEAGYRTAGFVGNLMLQRRLGFDRGFDRFAKLRRSTAGHMFRHPGLDRDRHNRRGR